MIFDRDRRQRSRLERELRAGKPEPSGDLTERIVRSVAGAGEPKGSSRRLRVVAGVALTMPLLVAMAASGGIGYAQTAVADTTSAAVQTLKRTVVSEPAQTTSASTSGSANFAAAAAAYPSLTCAFDWNGAAHSKFKIKGTTSVASGTISVNVTATPAGTGYPASDSVGASASWTTGFFPNTVTGTTYTATVTQTGAGDPATCIGSDVG